MAFRLQPDRTIEKEIIRLLQEQMTQAVRAALDRRHAAAERARQARVACKKIRATLELVRCHAPKRFQREGRRFRDAARRLADIRDQGAVSSTLQGLQPRAADHDRFDRRSFSRIRAAIAAQSRPQAGASLKPNPVLKTFCHEVNKARDRLEHFKIKESKTDGFAFLELGFHRSYARARTAFSEANKSADEDVLHTWRKRTKTHLNQCRLLERSCPRIMPSRVRALNRLASQLGAEHDLVVLRERIGATVFAPRDRSTVKMLLRQIARRLAALRSKARAIGEPIFVEKPRAFVTRVEADWNVARQTISRRDSLKARSRK